MAAPTNVAHLNNVCKKVTLIVATPRNLVHLMYTVRLSKCRKPFYVGQMARRDDTRQMRLTST